jgi:hypothetical protein
VAFYFYATFLLMLTLSKKVIKNIGGEKMKELKPRALVLTAIVLLSISFAAVPGIASEDATQALNSKSRLPHIEDATEIKPQGELAAAAVTWTEFINDPTGDTYAPHTFDIVGVDYAFADDTVSLRVRTDGTINILEYVGLTLLDTDENPETGDPVGTLMGIEYYVVVIQNGVGLLKYNPVTEEYEFVSDGISEGGYGDNYVWVSIPLSKLEDDGAMNVIQGVIDYETEEVTDIAPNRGVGHISPEPTETTISINDASAPQGATTTTKVMANGVTDLATFDLTISYDPSVVNVTGAANNQDLGTNMNNLEKAGEGEIRLVNFNIVSAGGGLSGDVLISTLTLEAVGTGGDKSALAITINTLANSGEEAISATPVNGIFKVKPSTDTTPPETTITAGPTGEINYNNVSFTWNGSDDDTPAAQLVYSYILEGYETSWSTWASGTSKPYTNLPDDGYTFKVKAKDLAGNVDPTPAERSFTVKHSETTVAIKINDASALPGDTTTTELRAKNIEDLATFDITVSYNASVVKVISATNNPKLGMDMNSFDHAAEGWVRLANFNIAPPGGGLDGDVLISTLTLEAVGTGGEKSTLAITINTLSNSTEGALPASPVNGEFSVVGPGGVKGDINGDGKVDINDAIYLAKHALGWVGYEMIYANGDVNCDGKVNINDATYLAKHALGWAGYERIC